MNVGVYKISKREGVKVTESMTKEELKELLRNFRDLQVQVQFIENIRRIVNYFMREIKVGGKYRTSNCSIRNIKF